MSRDDVGKSFFVLSYNINALCYQATREDLRLRGSKLAVLDGESGPLGPISGMFEPKSDGLSNRNTYYRCNAVRFFYAFVADGSVIMLGFSLHEGLVTISLNQNREIPT